MEREVFTLRQVEELLEEYVVASIVTDIGDEKANAVWKKYQPSRGAGIPHYAVINGDGEVVRSIGATLPAHEKAHQFVSFLKGEEIRDTVEDITDSAFGSSDRPVLEDGWPEGLLPGTYSTVDRAFDFEARFGAEAIKPGGRITLELVFKMKANEEGEVYHLYHRDTEFGLPLTVELMEHGELEPAGDWQYPDPEIHSDPDLGDEWYLVGDEIVIVRELKVPEDAEEGTVRVWGEVGGQYCDSSGCTSFNLDDSESSMRKFGFVASLAVSDEGAESAVSTASGSKAGTGGAADAPDRSLDGQISERGGLILFLLFAFAMGMVTLLTPCVLPVLPLTIGFFVSQHEKGRSSLLTALIYCTCIVASFTFFGIVTSLALGATGAQNIATNGYVNTFLGLLFLVFALSFLGLFELKAPDFMTGWFTKRQMSAQQEGRGYAKAFFSGSAFALISFSCTTPIAGAFLAGAATGSVWMPTLAMLAFSSGMALPVFVIGQFPSLMKKMPKSGGWMNAMKVVFGFIELGLAVMYISAAEQAFSSTIAEWVSRYVVLAVWISVSLAAALYLFGLFRMPHDHEKTDQIGVIRSVIAVGFLSFALYLLPGMFGAQFGATLEGILPEPPARGGIQLSVGDGGKPRNDIKALEWHRDLEKALEVSAKVNKPVFIDFTGFN